MIYDNTLSPRRILALCRKEGWQILRDPSSSLIAFVLPLVLLLIFGYGINLDTTRIRLGIWNGDGGRDSLDFVQALGGSPYVVLVSGSSRAALDGMLENAQIRGFVVLDADFSRSTGATSSSGNAEFHSSVSESSPGISESRSNNTASPASSSVSSSSGLANSGKGRLQVITDGADPNTANFVAAYVNGVWQQWAVAESRAAPPVVVQPRYWFNPVAESRHYLIPGSITLIMTVIGAMLTALVVAREWERGTMEALLASPVSRVELLLSKLLPYYVLGMTSMMGVTLCAVLGMGVPFRGSVPVLFLVSSVFLFSMLGIGLLISTLTRSQFASAQVTLSVAFLPAVILSGFIFEIASMPLPIRAVTYLLPPRYFVNALHTLFLAGDVWAVLWKDLLFLSGTSALFLSLAARATKRRLD